MSEALQSILLKQVGSKFRKRTPEEFHSQFRDALQQVIENEPLHRFADIVSKEYENVLRLNRPLLNELVAEVLLDDRQPTAQWSAACASAKIRVLRRAGERVFLSLITFS